MWMPVRRLIGAEVAVSRVGKREPQTMSSVGSRVHRREELRDLGRVVLAVAVDLDHVVVAVLVRRT